MSNNIETLLLFYVLPLLIFIVLVLLVLLYITNRILKNMNRVLNTVNNAKRCSSEDHLMIISRMQKWEPVIEKMEQMHSIMGPILKRKAHYDKTVDANRDETQLALQAGDLIQ